MVCDGQGSGGSSDLPWILRILADPISSNVKTQFGEDRGFLSENA